MSALLASAGLERLLPGLSGAPDVHPVFVHVPVVLIPMAAAFWIVAVARGNEQLFRVGRWLLYLGVLGAAAAVTTGFLATERMGHDSPGHDLVHVHRNWMVVAASLALALAIAAAALREQPRSRLPLALCALATSAVLLLGADRGALLVFRYGIGTRGDTPPAAHDHGDDHHGEGGGQDAHDHGGHGH